MDEININELITRETAIKLKKNGSDNKCLNCFVKKTYLDNRGFINNYCNVCGQKIEWVDKDE